MITGLTRYVTKAHLARAVLEATSWQTREVVDAMYQDSGVEITTLKVDGGMTSNNLLMQHQADVLDVPVVRPMVAETTCLGAAYAAGLAVGVWTDLDELRRTGAGRRVDPAHGGAGPRPRVPQLAQGRGAELRLGGGRRRAERTRASGVRARRHGPYPGRRGYGPCTAVPSSGGDGSGGGRAAYAMRVLDDADQHLLARLAVAGVAQHDRTSASRSRARATSCAG